MEKGILSGDIYDVITGKVKKSGCFDYEHNHYVSEGKCYVIEIESTSPVKRLAVPIDFILDEGEEIRAFFEKGDQVLIGSSLERKLKEIKTPKIIKAVSGKYIKDECYVDLELDQDYLDYGLLGKII